MFEHILTFILVVMHYVLSKSNAVLFFALFHWILCVSGVFCGGSVCHWSENGCMCSSSFVGTDGSSSSSSQEGHWRSVEKILLLHCRLYCFTVSAVYRPSTSALCRLVLLSSVTVNDGQRTIHEWVRNILKFSFILILESVFKGLVFYWITKWSENNHLWIRKYVYYVWQSCVLLCCVVC